MTLRKKVPLLLKLLISFALLGIFFWRTPLAQVWEHLRQMNGTTLLAATALALAAWWLSAVRLWCLLPEFRLATVVRMTFVSLFYTMVLPGQVAGDVVKAYKLAQTSRRAGHAEAATLVDRGMATFALFALGAVATLATSVVMPLRLLMCYGAAGIALIGVVLASRPFRTLVLQRGSLHDTNRLRRYAYSFAFALHDNMRQPRRMLASFSLALVFHALCVCIHVLLATTLGMHLSWPQLAVVYTGVTLVSLLPITIAGIGLRESGYVGLLALYDVDASSALSLSLAIFALLLVGALCGALVDLAAPPDQPVTHDCVLVRDSAKISIAPSSAGDTANANPINK